MVIWYALASLEDAERDFYGQLYETYRTGMLKYACSIVRDEQLAADVVQLSFLQLMAGAKLLDGMPDYKVKAYIAVTVRNTAIRTLHKRRELPAEVRGADVCPSQAGYVDTFTSLPDTSRDAVILRHVYGLKYREISRVLGISEDAAKKRVRRGLDTLGEDLKRGIADAAL